MQETFNTVASKVFDVLTTDSQQQGFSLVLDGTTGQQQAPVVLYAVPTIDITKPVIDAYNVKSGVPAPPPPAAGAPRPAASTPKPAAKPAAKPSAPAPH
jgi:outer membrane protein